MKTGAVYKKMQIGLKSINGNFKLSDFKIPAILRIGITAA